MLCPYCHSEYAADKTCFCRPSKVMAAPKEDKGVYAPAAAHPAAEIKEPGPERLPFRALKLPIP